MATDIIHQHEVGWALYLGSAFLVLLAIGLVIGLACILKGVIETWQESAKRSSAS